MREATAAAVQAPAVAEPSVFFREAGAGPAIVCLHANASSSSQWRGLMDRLAPRFHVLAADGYGAGKSPPWPSDRAVSLRDEVELLEPVFDCAGETFTLVGHSYGASVALVAATLMPERVRALALYEPTLFSLLDAEKPPPNDANGIRATVAGAVALLIADGPAAAAERFVDYWSGIGTWMAMPEARRVPIEAAIVNVAGWARSLLKEPTPLAAFAALDIPVLLMVGGRSPPSSRGVACLLHGALPKLTRVDLPSLGHMGPVTHPDVVNEVIADFIGRV
jgi:pimeloyl-ACP methyl ester carboxylesterase